jgi:hypothetical protein
MPYKDIEKNRMWHRNHMRMIRLNKHVTNSVSKYDIVTPSTLKLVTPKLDADGNIIYDN